MTVLSGDAWASKGALTIDETAVRLAAAAAGGTGVGAFLPLYAGKTKSSPVVLLRGVRVSAVRGELENPRPIEAHRKFTLVLDLSDEENFEQSAEIAAALAAARGAWAESETAAAVSLKFVSLDKVPAVHLDKRGSFGAFNARITRGDKPLTGVDALKALERAKVDVAVRLAGIWTRADKGECGVYLALVEAKITEEAPPATYAGASFFSASSVPSSST